MTKPRKRTIEVIAVLLMLASSSLSVTYSFADIDAQTGIEEQNTEKSVQKEGLGVILTEKMINGKLQVQHYALPDDTTKEDMQRILSSDTQTSGWAYVNYKAYHSGIILFDGKASKVGENLWEISSYDVLNPAERQFALELSENSNDSYAIMNESISDKDLNYKVIFSGKLTETYEENMLVIAFMNLSIKNPEVGQNMKFLQTGELSINSEKLVNSNLELKNSFW